MHIVLLLPLTSRPWTNLTTAEKVARLRMPPFPNATIRGPGLNATVFLPHATRGFYRSSRYDWGSMVGHIVLRSPKGQRNVTLCVPAHLPPHHPLATNHRIGLAAEFGCQTHGALCAGHWHGQHPVSNGALGYGDAGKNGTFAKLGVGLLVRPQKLRTDGFGYDFTYPYKLNLMEHSKWHMVRHRQGITLSHKVTHGKRWGWNLTRDVYVCGQHPQRPALCINVHLANTGTEDIRVPYSSGHAFNMLRGPTTGRGFAVSLKGSAAYSDLSHANQSSALPMERVADIHRGNGMTDIMVRRRLGEEEYASANFHVERSNWDGGFVVLLPAATGWHLAVRHTLRRDAVAARGGWFGFNLHISRRAISPRPYVLLDIPAGKTAEIEHRYAFEWRALS